MRFPRKRKAASIALAVRLTLAAAIAFGTLALCTANSPPSSSSSPSPRRPVSQTMSKRHDQSQPPSTERAAGPLAGAAFVSTHSTASAAAQDKHIFATYTGTADIHAPAPTGPYSGTLTANLGHGPRAGTTLVAKYSVSQSSPNHLEPGAENSVVISGPRGELTGIATDYQFAPGPPTPPIAGNSGSGAVLTISITGGTGRFQRVTGGELTMIQNSTYLDNGFPEHFVQSMTGTITGSLER